MNSHEEGTDAVGKPELPQIVETTVRVILGLFASLTVAAFMFLPIAHFSAGPAEMAAGYSFGQVDTWLDYSYSGVDVVAGTPTFYDHQNGRISGPPGWQDHPFGIHTDSMDRHIASAAWLILLIIPLASLVPRRRFTQIVVILAGIVGGALMVYSDWVVYKSMELRGNLLLLGEQALDRTDPRAANFVSLSAGCWLSVGLLAVVLVVAGGWLVKTWRRPSKA
jgi:hypothetical protein